jgi:penicillin-binding protein 2
VYKERSRINAIIFLFSVVFLILLLKAADLQLIDNTFKERGNTAAIDKQINYPERGLVYDRNGNLLVYNTIVYDLLVTVNKMDKQMDTARFCKLLNIDQESFEENLKKDYSTGRYSPNLPFIFARKLDMPSFARLQEHLHEFPGFTVQRRIARVYPHTHAANILGYIAEVDQDKIENGKGKYVMGDYIGATGLENFYEDTLRGSKGVEYVLKDNIGRRVGPYKDGTLDSVPVSGTDLVSTIDLDLQAYGESLLINKVGSIVALDPNSGEILAMVTAPGYDPNLLTIDRGRGRAYTDLLNDSLRPLFDRSIMARYPPGSIFKTVLSLIALEDGIISPNKGMSCGGAYILGRFKWGCRSHPHPGNIATALQYSCNTYYYQLLRDLVDKYGTRNVARGLDELAGKLNQFGLGTKLGLDIPNETAGYIPTSDRYDRMYGTGRWRSSAIISLGIGQGELLMNTVQMANLAAIIANRGDFYQPHLISAFRDTAGQVIPRVIDKLHCGVSVQHFEPVIEGMSRAVSGGSASSAWLPDIEICGKTGTSQNPHGDDHSVFIAFAPRDNPQMAIAVYVENSGYGGRYAAPIASLMIEKYLTGEIRESRKWVETRMLEADLIKRPALYSMR